MTKLTHSKLWATGLLKKGLSFGASGAWEATITMNPAWHFVGGALYSITPLAGGKFIKIEITNTSSVGSLMHIVTKPLELPDFPSWERGGYPFGSTIRQHIWWIEGYY